MLRLLLLSSLVLLGWLRGTNQEVKAGTLPFKIDANSFFTLLVFNRALRATEFGSMGLIPASAGSLPEWLSSSGHLILEKSHETEPFDLVLRDGQTVIFNIEGLRYDYDAASHRLEIQEGDFSSLKPLPINWDAPRTAESSSARFPSLRPPIRSRLPLT